MDDKKPMNGPMDANGKPMDENMTINVKNPQLEDLLGQYAKEKTNQKLNELLNCIHRCRLLVPANLNQDKKPTPCFIKSKKEELFLPVYTTKEQIPENPRSQAVLNMPYDAINKMAADPKLNATGIVINPFSDNLIFKKELLEKIQEVNDKRRSQQANGAAQPQGKTMKLTADQYNALMRKQLEFGFLPKKFFAEGQAFMDELCDRKEEYLDELYEESYQEKRLYPFLPEDFSVMAMDINEELLVVRVDFPTRYMAIPSCHRVYFTWNPKKQEGRYFTIEKTKEKEAKLLGEMTSELKHESFGIAPVEGAELQEIINLQQSQGLTS